MLPVKNSNSGENNKCITEGNCNSRVTQAATFKIKMNIQCRECEYKTRRDAGL
jgi:hypothetical protein